MANAGLTAEEAAGTTLNQIAAHKFSRGTENAQTVVDRNGVTVSSRSADSADRSQLIANAGLTPEQAAGMTLSQIAAHKFSRDGGDQ